MESGSPPLGFNFPHYGLTHVLLIVAMISVYSVRGAAQSSTSGVTVTGAVLQIDGEPIPYAYVFERETGRFVIADYDGKFRLIGLPNDRALVIGARRIGYEPMDTAVVGATTAVLALRLKALPNILEPVRVKGRTGDYDEYLDRRGYYRRMARATGGTFISSAEFERRNPAEITQVLRDIPGVRVISTGGSRGVKKSAPLGRGGLCVLGLALDGFRVEFEAPSTEDLQPRVPAIMSGGRTSALQNRSAGKRGTLDELVPPSMVRAIEVYPSAASVPNDLQHLAEGCGLIVVWTKYD